MALADAKVEAIIAVSDMGKATDFYEGKLGLSGGKDQPDGGRQYTCAGGTRIHLYPSPDNAGKSGATLAGFEVDDVDAAVDELSGNGITFEQYDTDQLKTDEKGIADMGDSRGAWMKDPDGNIVAVYKE